MNCGPSNQLCLLFIHFMRAILGGYLTLGKPFIEKAPPHQISEKLQLLL